MDEAKTLEKTDDGSPEQINQLSEKFGGRKPTADMAAVLRVMLTSDAKPIETLSADDARDQPTPTDAVKALLEERGESTDPEVVGDVNNTDFKGPDGDVDIRIYTPASAKIRKNELLPVVLYIHGGGWVIADLDVYDSSPRAICNRAHCIVVSTHYRQGPEHRFPAAHEDTFAAYRWVLENIREHGGDPSSVAVVGESAGGNMAAAVSLRARETGVQLPIHQVLVYPVADYHMNSESYAEMKDAAPLNSPMMAWFFDNYLRTPADGQSEAISIVHANLAGLPPTTIINAELDPLRTEGEKLADRLNAAGVKVSQKTYAGVTHEFFGMLPVLPAARDAQDMAAEALRKAFGN